MRRILLILILGVMFLLSVRKADASIIVIDKKGEIIWNVLASESSVAMTAPDKTFDVIKVADQGNTYNEISLDREGSRVNLKVGDKSELDVTNLGSDLISIEERGEIKRIEIGIKDDKFSIEESGIIALTQYPINIDPVENKLSLITSTGKKFLRILPFEAGQVALRSKTLSKITQNIFDITEENKDISYQITGERTINVFNLIKLNIPIQTKISASTGEIISVDQPTWLKVLGFVFS